MLSQSKFRTHVPIFGTYLTNQDITGVEEWFHLPYPSSKEQHLGGKPEFIHSWWAASHVSFLYSAEPTEACFTRIHLVSAVIYRTAECGLRAHFLLVWLDIWQHPGVYGYLPPSFITSMQECLTKYLHPEFPKSLFLYARKIIIGYNMTDNRANVFLSLFSNRCHQICAIKWRKFS